MSETIAETKTVWVAWTNTDCTEGRGYEVPLAVCAAESTARRMGERGGGGDDGMTIDNSHQHLEAFDAHELLIFATRYCTGRKTIAAASFARDLAEAWPTIPAHTRRVIQRDLERELEDDDKARAEGRAFRPLGMDCDRQEWEMVRQAWQREDETS